jgi:hypothetical protein
MRRRHFALAAQARQKQIGKRLSHSPLERLALYPRLFSPQIRHPLPATRTVRQMGINLSALFIG